jgi:hypothetical protein
VCCDRGNARTHYGRFAGVNRRQANARSPNLGGKIGLLTAARDERVRATAAVAAFTPLRTSANKGTEGVWHYSHLHGLIPRMGFFIGNEPGVTLRL